MEAGKTKRAALRLAATGGGLLLTLTLVVVTIGLLVGGRNGTAETVNAKPEWDAIKTGESYQLPIAEITPVSSVPAVPAPYYEPPPAYVATQQASDPQQPEAEPQTPVAKRNPWDGPVTIHNPAAFGPPEDGSLPPIPTPRLSPTPASEPVPRLATRPHQGPTFTTPVVKPPAVWEEPLVVEEALESEVLEDASGTIPDRDRLAANREARELRDLAVKNEEDLLGYTTSTNDLSKRLSSDVQAGFQLGKSGAVYAARAKFVSVLRRIALAKDAEEGGTRHATALAEGLRTLDDADDFVPRGDALEAELDVASISSSHGLRLVSAEASVAPHQAIARYSQHAAAKLAEAAASEPAGSMALYGLGKSYARLEAQGGDTNAGRKSLVMYRAATDTHGENYLAANELGVTLARNGRYEQASEVLRQAASQPTAIATVHANLAAIENRLGRSQQAVVAQDYSEQLAQQERAAGDVSRRHGVQWVNPEAFRRAGPPGLATPQQPIAQQPVPQPMLPPQYAPQPYTPQPGYAVTPQPREESGGWHGFVRTAKRTVGWSSPEPAQQSGYARPPVVVPQGRVLR